MGVRVLIVEDCLPVRQALCELLELAGGYEVVATSDTATGAVAWLAAQPHGVDLVICDLELREGHGLQVLRALRQLAGRRGPDVVVFSESLDSLRGRSAMPRHAPRFTKSRHAELIRWLEHYHGQMALPMNFQAVPPITPAPRRRPRAPGRGRAGSPGPAH